MRRQDFGARVSIIIFSLKVCEHLFFPLIVRLLQRTLYDTGYCTFSCWYLRRRKSSVSIIFIILNGRWKLELELLFLSCRLQLRQIFSLARILGKIERLTWWDLLAIVWKHLYVLTFWWKIGPMEIIYFSLQGPIEILNVLLLLSSLHRNLIKFQISSHKLKIR